MTAIPQKSNHPEWALKQKRKGTELRLINDHYYLYEVTSKWNPDKKRAQKITGKLLGRVTPEGFIESDKQKLRDTITQLAAVPVYTKEYGASHFVVTHFNDYTVCLRDYFPDIWREIMTLAFIRLVYQSPIKNIQFRYENSYLSERYSDLSLTDKKVSSLFRQIGSERAQTVSFMQTFIRGGDYILIDGTPLISHSKHIDLVKPGYNSQQLFASQLNLMFLFSTKLKLPVYYRILPGNIREVKAFKLTLEESGLTDAVIISDKGFFSQANVDCLETERLNYIIPLRRNSTLINYEPIEQPRKTGFDHYFCYHNRFIWHYTIDYPRRKVVVFFDEQLKVREISDYLKRIETHPESYQLANFKEKESSLGTLAVLNNLQEKTPEAIYHYYKSRDNIEIMFDAMKNILEADASYMQNELALQGWMFINHIALQWYYQIYQLLTQKGLGSKYSVIDILSHLAEIRKVKINGNWKTAEINAKTVAVLEKLGIPIT